MSLQHRNDDDPITAEEGDFLGRYEYAKRVAKQIAATHSDETSVVFGLSGPWGCGKTSLVNLIEKALDPGEYSVVRFTPWAAHDVNSLLAEFYAALLSALPKDKVGAARDALGTLLRIAAPMAMAIPIGGETVTAAVTAASNSLTGLPPWSDAFETAAKKIAKNTKKILVVVDDIDRLQGDELLTVLKVVRLLGRFPGVQYLLAYDHDSLMHTLTTAGAVQSRDEARRYIEKMVQYPVPVPALIGAQIISLLNAGIDDVMKRHRPDTDRTRLHRLQDLVPTMRATLNTPRSISRYISQLDYDLSMHPPGETDAEDIIGLTLLRVVFPEIHTKLPQYQQQLVTTRRVDGAAVAAGLNDREPFDIDEILTDLDNAVAKDHARAMLHMLFPKFASEHKINRRRGVATPSYFGRYFTMTILSDFDIPDSDVTEAIQAAVDGDGTRLVELLTTENQPLAFLALEKAEEAFTTTREGEPDPTGKDQLCVGLLNTLAPVLDDLDDPESFLRTLHHRACQWMAREVLAAISEDAEPAPIVNALTQIREPQTRIVVLHYASSSPRMHDKPQWWASALRTALPDAQAAFLHHLGQKDLAPEERQDLIGFFRMTHEAGVDLDPTREAIATAIAANEFDIDHLAARFITPRNDPNIIYRNQSDFDIIAPRGDYDWYTQPERPFGNIDIYKWEGRRMLAAGRITRPTNI